MQALRIGQGTISALPPLMHLKHLHLDIDEHLCPALDHLVACTALETLAISYWKPRDGCITFEGDFLSEEASAPVPMLDLSCLHNLR